MLHASATIVESRREEICRRLLRPVVRPLFACGQGGNWIQAVPRKGLFLILRLYRPLEPRFDKAPKPAEIELLK
jgi:hypothetical protein